MDTGDERGGQRNISPIPLPSLEELGQRIDTIARAVGGKKQLAHDTRISESHIYRYIAGRSEPSTTRLVALANAGGVSLNWLASGEAESHDDATSSTETPLPDLDTLETVVRRIRRQLRERDIQLEPDVEARLIRFVVELCHRHREPLGEPMLAEVIDLIASR